MVNKQRLKIIGLSGTNGSGKDAIGTILADQFGYFFISVTDALREEAVRRGWTAERKYTSIVSTDWRREFGLAVLVERALQKYQQAGGDQKYKGVVMASLRNPFEADKVHELGGVVIWVDADPEVRYSRTVKNVALRGNRGDESASFEHFLADEAAEMRATSNDDNGLNMSAVKQKADLTLLNNSDSLNELTRTIKDTLHL
ncbi:MAG TPA: AAA family ATPase [Candidatus Saccharimonadales bacterium]|nr:AAA family ATPase [Candidatus Saccharimonadales bacterium]